MRKKWEMKNWQREQMSQMWTGNGSEEDCNCDYIKSNVERVEEGKHGRRNWRLLAENVVRET